jgi:hypothetical protein
MEYDSAAENLKLHPVIRCSRPHHLDTLQHLYIHRTKKPSAVELPEKTCVQGGMRSEAMAQVHVGGGHLWPT